MRTLILAITMSFVFSLPSIAASNGDLYKHCKMYIDKSFDLIKSGDEGRNCFIYFAATRDFSATICVKYSKEEELSPEAKNALNQIRKDYGSSSFGEANSLDAAIQHYVNEMEKKPAEWKYNPTYYVIDSLQAIGGFCPE